MTWMQTYSGLAFEFDSDDKTQICIEDIATHLSKICRFNGACKTFYSVAQHSIYVSQDLKNQSLETQLYGLLHDAAEAYIGDIIRPLKNSTYINLENKILCRIMMSLDLYWERYLFCRALIKDSDDRLLFTERNQLMLSPPQPWDFEREASPIKIKPWGWKKSEKKFLECYYELRKEL